MSSSGTILASQLATKVIVTKDTLTFDLNDGRTISAPLDWYPRLVDGTPEERNNLQLIGNGAGVHWPDLDEDISVANLLQGRPSGESQASLRRWLAARRTGKPVTLDKIRPKKPCDTL